jgi:cytochrome b involved in lipid metabolism
LAEVAEHPREGDCWVAIDGLVYDITAYLPDHPSEPELILPWCGREATQAWRTKGKGRPHSPRASQLLEKHKIGALR